MNEMTLDKLENAAQFREVVGLFATEILQMKAVQDAQGHLLQQMHIRIKSQDQRLDAQEKVLVDALLQPQGRKRDS